MIATTEVFDGSNITCCAVAQSRVLRTAWVLYANMETSTPHRSETSFVITMELCRFDNVNATNTNAKFGWNPPAWGCSKHTWNIHLWLLPSFLPYRLFPCSPAKAKRTEIISHTLAQKNQFGVRKCPLSKCFSLIWLFGGRFTSEFPQFRPPAT